MSVEKKDGYTIIDRRTPEGKEFGEAQDESLDLIEKVNMFSVCFDANSHSHKKPGGFFEYFKNRYHWNFDKLNLKTNIHKSINWIKESK